MLVLCSKVIRVLCVFFYVLGLYSISFSRFRLLLPGQNRSSNVESSSVPGSFLMVFMSGLFVLSCIPSSLFLYSVFPVFEV